MDETFSHRNVWTVCNIQMLRMLHDVWLFFFFPQSYNFLIWIAFLMLQNADAKLVFHDRAFIKKHYWWKCEVLAKSLEQVNEFFHFSSLISLLAVSYLAPLLHNSNSYSPGDIHKCHTPRQICPSYADFSSISELQFRESINPITTWNLMRMQHTFQKI